MGIEFHNQPDWLTKYVEVSNLVFSVIFLIEMILKLSAYGFFRYISDGFNVFDGLIVILRSVSTTVFKYCNIFEALSASLFNIINLLHCPISKQPRAVDKSNIKINKSSGTPRIEPAE